MKKAILISVSALLTVLSCKDSSNKNIVKQSTNDPQEIKDCHVITKEEQERLSPDDVISDLKNGNQKFLEGLPLRHNMDMICQAANGQFPEAVVLSCIDSRVPVEDIFHQAIGDLFVTRVAGNVIDDDVLGSLEYACVEAGSKVIVVLGHEKCGAIAAGIKGVKQGNITQLLAKINPSIDHVKKENPKLDFSIDNAEFVNKVTNTNVLNSIEKIKSGSPILNEMLEKHKIKIVGAVYNVKNGEVHFL